MQAPLRAGWGALNASRQRRARGWGGDSGAGAPGSTAAGLWSPQRPAGLVLLLPGAPLRSGRLADPAHRERHVRRHQDEPNAALPPQGASPVVIAQFLQRRKPLSRFGALVVRVGNDEAARGEAMVGEHDASARYEKVVPGPRAVAKHPGQGRQGIHAEARARNTGPTPGVGAQHSGDAQHTFRTLFPKSGMVFRGVPSSPLGLTMESHSRTCCYARSCRRTAV